MISSSNDIYFLCKRLRARCRVRLWVQQDLPNASIITAKKTPAKVKNKNQIKGNQIIHSNMKFKKILYN